MKSFALFVTVVACVFVALCSGQNRPGEAKEPDTYPNNATNQAGCCTKGGGVPAGVFCPRPGVQCRCCTEAGYRNCGPVMGAAMCGTKTSSCQL